MVPDTRLFDKNTMITRILIISSQDFYAPIIITEKITTIRCHYTEGIQMMRVAAAVVVHNKQPKPVLLLHQEPLLILHLILLEDIGMDLIN